jgi:hypothetical protein
LLFSAWYLLSGLSSEARIDEFVTVNGNNVRLSLLFDVPDC